MNSEKPKSVSDLAKEKGVEGKDIPLTRVPEDDVKTKIMGDGRVTNDFPVSSVETEARPEMPTEFDSPFTSENLLGVEKPEGDDFKLIEPEGLDYFEINDEFIIALCCAMSVIDPTVREVNLRSVTFTITKGTCTVKATDFQCHVYREFKLANYRLSGESVSFSIDAINLFEILKRAKSKKYCIIYSDKVAIRNFDGDQFLDTLLIDIDQQYKPHHNLELLFEVPVKNFLSAFSFISSYINSNSSIIEIVYQNEIFFTKDSFREISYRNPGFGKVPFSFIPMDIRKIQSFFSNFKGVEAIKVKGYRNPAKIDELILSIGDGVTEYLVVPINTGNFKISNAIATFRANTKPTLKVELPVDRLKRVIDSLSYSSYQDSISFSVLDSRKAVALSASTKKGAASHKKIHANILDESPAFDPTKFVMYINYPKFLESLRTVTAQHILLEIIDSGSGFTYIISDQDHKEIFMLARSE